MPIISSDSEISREQATEAVVQARFLKESDVARIVADFDTIYKEDGNFYDVSETLKPSTEALLKSYSEANADLIAKIEQIAKGDKVSADEFNKVMENENEKIIF